MVLQLHQQRALNAGVLASHKDTFYISPWGLDVRETAYPIQMTMFQ